VSETIPGNTYIKKEHGVVVDEIQIVKEHYYFNTKNIDLKLTVEPKYISILNAYGNTLEDCIEDLERILKALKEEK